MFRIPGVAIVLTAGLLARLSCAAEPTNAITLKVAAVQFRSSFDVADNRQRMIATLEKLAARQVSVAAFPECALTGYHAGPVMAASAGEIEAAEGEIAR